MVYRLAVEFIQKLNAFAFPGLEKTVTTKEPRTLPLLLTLTKTFPFLTGQHCSILVLLPLPHRIALLFSTVFLFSVLYLESAVLHDFPCDEI